MRGHLSTAAFVGRAAELDALVGAYSAAAAGQGTTALVGGEAGVGKSRLVGEVAAHARRDGARVLVGQCLDLEEGGLPYAPLVDILRTLDRELSPQDGAATLAPLLALLGRSHGDTRKGDTRYGDTPRGGARPGDRGPGDEPASRPPAGPVGQARLFELLLTVIERLVESRPLVLVVEDLHWADRSTLDLVSLLASSTRALPVLTLGTYRTEDVPPRHPLRPVTAELTRRGARHLQLERLRPGDVAELLGRLLDHPPPAEITASVVERSDGNPLFVEELAAALVGDPDAPMPPHLRDAVLSRVERLPDEAAAVLRACAAGGREVTHDLLVDALAADPDAAGSGAHPTAEIDAPRLDRALRACVEGRLLIGDQRRGSYRFRHALVHEAVLGDVLPGELHRLHRSYATALERRHAGPRSRGDQDWARLAHHWDAAAEYDAALRAAVRAGRAAEHTFAVPEAHRYLEWSVRLWDRALDPEAAAGCDRGELLARAADAASRCGAMARALTLVDEALAAAPVADDPARAGLLHERRGWYLHRSGSPDDDLAAYELAVELVPRRPPTAARARVAHAHAHALVRVGRSEEARAGAEEAIALARAVDDPVEEGQALHVLGLVLATEGRADDAVARLHEAGRIAADHGDLAEVAGAYVHLWRTLVEAGRGDDLVDLILAAEVSSAAGARPTAAPTLMGSIGAAALHQLGRWEEAEQLLEDARRAGDAGHLTAAARTLVSGALAVDRGDHGRARDELETARTWCHQVGDGRLNGLLHRALADLAIWQSRYDDARREVATGLDLLAHTGDPELAARLAAVGVRAEAERAEQARRLGGRSAATGDAARVADLLVARLEQLAELTRLRNAPPSTEAEAALLTGRAERSRLDDQPDPDGWRMAVAAWDAIGFPYPAAYARLRLAEAAKATGDDDRAVGALTAAWHTARRLDAVPLAESLARLARRGRVRLPGTESDGSGAGGTDSAAPDVSLTSREREVLALVAEGRTNRQIGELLFISQKTVSVHVSRLLAKLGAATRGEAAAIARRTGQLGEAPGP